MKTKKECETVYEEKCKTVKKKQCTEEQKPECKTIYKKVKISKEAKIQYFYYKQTGKKIKD